MLRAFFFRHYDQHDLGNRMDQQLVQKAKQQFLTSAGEVGALMRAMDWSQTPLGPVQDWPQSLRTGVSICLHSRFELFIWWGRAAIGSGRLSGKAVHGARTAGARRSARLDVKGATRSSKARS